MTFREAWEAVQRGEWVRRADCEDDGAYGKDTDGKIIYADWRGVAPEAMPEPDHCYSCWYEGAEIDIEDALATDWEVTTPERERVRWLEYLESRKVH